MEISKELPDQCDNDNSPRMKLLQSLRFSLLPSMNAWLQEVLTMTNTVKTPQNWKGGDGTTARQNARSLFLLLCSLFFPNKCSLDVYKPSVNFQSSEKLTLIIFTNALTALTYKRLFRAPYSTILTDVTIG